MKRILSYVARDGQKFPDRATARQHEINHHRREHVGELLRQLLKARNQNKRFGVTKMADAICRQPHAFALALSARAADRALQRRRQKAARG